MNLGFAVSVRVAVTLSRWHGSAHAHLICLQKGKLSAHSLGCSRELREAGWEVLSTKSTLAKYSLYSYRYHLNQPLAAGLEKPLLPHTGLSPQSWQLLVEGAAPQKTVNIWFETRV